MSSSADAGRVFRYARVSEILNRCDFEPLYCPCPSQPSRIGFGKPAIVDESKSLQRLRLLAVAGRSKWSCVFVFRKGHLKGFAVCRRYDAASRLTAKTIATAAAMAVGTLNLCEIIMPAVCCRGTADDSSDRQICSARSQAPPTHEVAKPRLYCLPAKQQKQARPTQCSPRNNRSRQTNPLPYLIESTPAAGPGQPPRGPAASLRASEQSTTGVAKFQLCMSTMQKANGLTSSPVPSSGSTESLPARPDAQ